MEETSRPVPSSPRAIRTRAAIVRAAGETFAERGYDSAPTQEIARRAGVAEGTLFLHFGSKAGLMLAVMQEFYEALMRGAHAAATGHEQPMARLRALLRHYVGAFEAQASLIKVFSQQGRFGEPTLHAEFTRLNRTYTRLYMDLLRDMKNAGQLRARVPEGLLRDAMFGAIEHFALAHFHSGRDYDLDALVDDLLDLLLCGAASDPSLRLGRIERKLDELLARPFPSPEESP